MAVLNHLLILILLAIFFMKVAPAIDLARRHSVATAGNSGSADAQNLHMAEPDTADYNWNYEAADDYQLRDFTTSKAKVSPPPLTTPTREESQRRSGTYLYCFSYPTRFDVYPRWADGVHGDDMAYVFGAPLAGVGGVRGGGAVAVGWAGGGATVDPFPLAFTRADKFLSELVMQYWAGFIHTGYV